MENKLYQIRDPLNYIMLPYLNLNEKINLLHSNIVDLPNLNDDYDIKTLLKFFSFRNNILGKYLENIYDYIAHNSYAFMNNSNISRLKYKRSIDNLYYLHDSHIISLYTQCDDACLKQNDAYPRKIFYDYSYINLRHQVAVVRRYYDYYEENHVALYSLYLINLLKNKSNIII